MTMHEHRLNLKELSAQITTTVQQVEKEESVNSKLEKYYSNGEDLLFRTFEEWQNLGYKVSKGEKSFKFWGVPQEFEIRDKKDPSKISDIGVFCPVVFKFSENQVYNPQNLR